MNSCLCSTARPQQRFSVKSKPIPPYDSWQRYFERIIDIQYKLIDTCAVAHVFLFTLTAQFDSLQRNTQIRVQRWKTLHGVRRRPNSTRRWDNGNHPIHLNIQSAHGLPNEVTKLETGIGQSFRVHCSSSIVHSVQRTHSLELVSYSVNAKRQVDR